MLNEDDQLRPDQQIEVEYILNNHPSRSLKALPKSVQQLLPAIPEDQPLCIKLVDLKTPEKYIPKAYLYEPLPEKKKQEQPQPEEKSWQETRLKRLAQKYPFTIASFPEIELPDPFLWEVSQCQAVYQQLCNKKHIGRLTALSIHLERSNNEAFYLMGSNRGATIAFYMGRWLIFSDGDFRRVLHLAIRDEKVFASSFQNTVRLYEWRARGGARERSFQIYDNKITCLAFTQKLLLAALQSGDVRCIEADQSRNEANEYSFRALLSLEKRIQAMNYILDKLLIFATNELLIYSKTFSLTGRFRYDYQPERVLLNGHGLGHRFRVIVAGDNLVRLFQLSEQQVTPISHYHYPKQHYCEGLEIQNEHKFILSSDKESTVVRLVDFQEGLGSFVAGRLLQSPWKWAVLKYSGSKYSFAVRFNQTIFERAQEMLSLYVKNQLQSHDMNALKTLLAVAEGRYQGFLYNKHQIKSLSETVIVAFMATICGIQHPQVLEIRLCVVVQFLLAIGFEDILWKIVYARLKRKSSVAGLWNVLQSYILRGRVKQLNDVLIRNQMVQYYLMSKQPQAVKALLFGPQLHCDLRQLLPLFILYNQFQLVPPTLLSLHSTPIDFLSPFLYLVSILHDQMPCPTKTVIVRELCGYVRQCHAGLVRPHIVVDQATSQQVVALILQHCFVPSIMAKILGFDDLLIYRTIQHVFFSQPIFKKLLQKQALFDSLLVTLKSTTRQQPPHQQILTEYSLYLLSQHTALPSTNPVTTILAICNQSQIVLEWPESIDRMLVRAIGYLSDARSEQWEAMVEGFRRGRFWKALVCGLLRMGRGGEAVGVYLMGNQGGARKKAFGVLQQLVDSILIGHSQLQQLSQTLKSHQKALSQLSPHRLWQQLSRLPHLLQQQLLPLVTNHTVELAFVKKAVSRGEERLRMRWLELSCMVDREAVEAVVGAGGWLIDQAFAVLERHGCHKAIGLLFQQAKDYSRSISYYLKHLDHNPSNFPELASHCQSLCSKANDEHTWLLFIQELLKKATRTGLRQIMLKFLLGVTAQLVENVDNSMLASLCLEGVAVWNVSFWVELWKEADIDHRFVRDGHLLTIKTFEIEGYQLKKSIFQLSEKGFHRKSQQCSLCFGQVKQQPSKFYRCGHANHLHCSISGNCQHCRVVDETAFLMWQQIDAGKTRELQTRKIGEVEERMVREGAKRRHVLRRMALFDQAVRKADLSFCS